MTDHHFMKDQPRLQLGEMQLVEDRDRPGVWALPGGERLTTEEAKALANANGLPCKLVSFPVLRRSMRG